MRKISLLLFVFSLAFFSCASSEHWKMRLEISGTPKFDLKPYQKVFLTNFLIKKETQDFNINKELQDYLSFELEKKANIKVEALKAPSPNQTQFDKPEHWRTLAAPDKENDIIVSGALEYTQEVRKALIQKDKKRYEDPFPQETKLMERKFYTLNLDVYFISTQNGKVLYKRSFKETKAYKNPNQTAYFAFFELIQKIRDKLFLDIHGGQRIQERYLIREEESP